jgi:type II secretory pathway pseudopilin PulG
MLRNAYKAKKRYITLIEIMIVMFLIALITGVIAYNYRGTLEEGKAFKTKAAIEKLETILSLEIANHPDEKSTISTGWKSIIDRSPLVHDPKALEKDGWGDEYVVEINDETDAITVTSKRYNEYKMRK